MNVRFVADGHRRLTHNAEFRAREEAVRRTVAAEFVPRLAAARGVQARWRGEPCSRRRDPAMQARLIRLFCAAECDRGKSFG